MDIEKKLSYYRSGKKQDEKKQGPEISASLKALAEIFKAEICQPQAPYLKICQLYPLPKEIYKDSEISLDLLTKKTIKENIHLDDCLFFDLETTGLAGGTGTYPFLLGFGYFRNNVLHVEQYFLPDFGREFYLFKELDEFFRRFAILVSYNGKSFDYPLLRNRFVMNKLNAEWTHWQHIDLLHIVRRIWGDSFPSRDLQTIEREVLDRKREGDIPGYLIPDAYFDYVRSGRIHEVKRIIEHNYLDILSSAELIIKCGQINNSPEELQDEAALLRLAALAFKLDDFDYFMNIDKLLAKENKTVPKKMMYLRSLFYKRRKDWEQALENWNGLISQKEYMFFALEELAKYYEHATNKFEKALQYTEKALGHYSVLEELNPYGVNPDIQNAFLKRKKRLKEKISSL